MNSTVETYRDTAPGRAPAPQRPSRVQRVFGQRWVHRAYPLRLGVRYARRRTEKQWADPGFRAHAVLQMQAATGRPDAMDLEPLAKRYVFEMNKRDELAWRIWLTTRMPVDRMEILRAAASRGGVIVSFMHHGQYGGVFGSLARHGVATQVAVDEWFFTQRSQKYNGLRGRQHLRTINQGGAQAFPAASGAYAKMREILEAGEALALASDLPGNTPVRFHGREIGAPSGAPRLALETGAPIVPVTAHRDGNFQRLAVGDPIDPREHDDYRLLLAEIFARHEPAVAAWPEAVERPVRRFRPLSDADLARFGSDPAGEFFKQTFL